MIILKILCNLLFLFIGLGTISVALRDRKIKISWYPKWLWILELIVGIIASLHGFTVWFV